MKKYRNSNNPDHFLLYESQCQLVSKLLVSTRQDYYRNMINDNRGNQRLVFQVADKLLHHSPDPVYPTHDSPEELCEDFANFFSDKISKLTQDIITLQATLPEDTMDLSEYHTQAVFSEFKLLDCDQVTKLVKQSPNKSCSLDPVPTSVIKDNVEVMAPHLTRIINASFSTSVVPDQLKDAHLSPLLKKSNLDSDIKKNYRPISNLPYLSKLVEKSADIQLVEHCIEHELFEVFQSAYKQYHSTETALLKVHNDAMCAIDMEKAMVIFLIDMSAAFDTVNHDIMLERLNTYIGVTGSALEWFRSYLKHRTQTVTLLGASSSKHELKYGVPQGSILGPRLFAIYTLPIGHILRKYYPDAKFMFFADDKDFYLVFDPGNPQYAVTYMEPLIAEIRAWLIRNFLMVNDSKTDALAICSRYQPPVAFPPVRVGDDLIHPSATVRNLGVIFDTNMTMESQISSVVRQSFLSLRDMYKVRQSLPRDATETMVHAFVTTRLDYCNSLYYGLPKEQIKRL